MSYVWVVGVFVLIYLWLRFYPWQFLDESVPPRLSKVGDLVYWVNPDTFPPRLYSLLHLARQFQSSALWVAPPRVAEFWLQVGAAQWFPPLAPWREISWLQGRPIRVPRLCSGLGNQLFHAMMLYGLTLRDGSIMAFDPTFARTSPHDDRQNYIETVFRNFPLYSLGEQYHKCFLLDLFSFTELSDEPFTLYYRAFFNYRSFHPYRARILELLQVPQYPRRPNTWFIHIRFGDWMKLYAFRFSLDEYYRKAIAAARRQVPAARFLLFSNEPARARQYLEQVVGLMDFELAPPDLSAWESMGLMASCWLGGICPPSTFSWWGGYLNPNPARIIYFPLKKNRGMTWVFGDEKFITYFAYENCQILSL